VSIIAPTTTTVHYARLWSGRTASRTIRNVPIAARLSVREAGAETKKNPPVYTADFLFNAV